MRLRQWDDNEFRNSSESSTSASLEGTAGLTESNDEQGKVELHFKLEYIQIIMKSIS